MSRGLRLSMHQDYSSSDDSRETDSKVSARGYELMFAFV